MSKYYDGPGGVFYDVRHDKIFVLIKDCSYLANKKFQRIGGFYLVYNANKPVSTKPVTITGIDQHVTRLGEL